MELHSFGHGQMTFIMIKISVAGYQNKHLLEQLFLIFFLQCTSCTIFFEINVINIIFHAHICKVDMKIKIILQFSVVHLKSSS